MKILHLASFTGNIGDNASHQGFHNLLFEVIGKDYTTEQLEIRRFYNNYNLSNKYKFDESFVEKVNKYDVLFIGGGGFLDFDVSDSETGTTININANVLDQIKIPILISSIGANPRNQVPTENVIKFKSFLDAFLSRQNRFLGLRNDGSKQAIAKYLGNTYSDAIPEVLDHGFFYKNNGKRYCPTAKSYILVNSTSDQIEMTNPFVSKSDSIWYNMEMQKVVSFIINETNYDLVFAPHIYSDYKAIDVLIRHLNDFHLRTRVFITPYAQGDYGANQIFSAYKNASLVLGMRFHANVCSLALGVPVIGIAALDRVKKMYESVELAESSFDVDSNLSKNLILAIQQMHNGIETVNILTKRKNAQYDLYRNFLVNI